MSYQMLVQDNHVVSRQSSTGNYNDFPDVPFKSSKEQIMMWQQNSYMADSGINSGYSTHAPPTLCGKEDFDAEQAGYEWTQQQSYNQDFTQDVEIKQELYQPSQCMQEVPGPQEESMDVPVVPINHTPMANPQSLTPPSEMLKFAFASCLNNQDETDLSLIPELVRLLSDNDEVVVNQAARMVHQLWGKESLQQGIMNSPDVVAALVQVMAFSKNLETIKHVVSVIHGLSSQQPGLMSIYKSNGIPALVHLVSWSVNSPTASILIQAVTTLHNLFLHQEGAKEEFCRLDGLQMMVRLLTHHNETFLAVVADCLRLLSLKNEANKLMICGTGGTAHLVRIMKSSSCRDLLWHTSRLLQVLATCSNNKTVIVQSEGIYALAMHLNDQSHKLVLSCLRTLRNLSDAATGQVNVFFLARLLELLSSNDLNVVTYATGILSNITCNNHQNKVAVCKEKGIVALLQAIMQAKGQEEIIEPAVCTLRHLTCRHPDAEKAQNAIREKHAIPLIVKLLCPPNRWLVIKAAIGLIRNLALCPKNHMPLRELGTISQLWKLCILAYEEIQKHRFNSSCNSSSPACVDGVRMQDIVEGTLSALQILAWDGHNRAFIQQLNVMEVLVKVLHTENEHVQCLVARLLRELSADPGAILMMESAGVMVPLCSSLSSANEELASHSRSILEQLVTLKPQMYCWLAAELPNLCLDYDPGPCEEMPEVMASLNLEEVLQERLAPTPTPEGSDMCVPMDSMLEHHLQMQEAADVRISLSIPPDLSFESTFDTLQPIFHSPTPNGRFSQDTNMWFHSAPPNCH